MIFFFFPSSCIPSCFSNSSHFVSKGLTFFPTPLSVFSSHHLSLSSVFNRRNIRISSFTSRTSLNVLISSIASSFSSSLPSIKPSTSLSFVFISRYSSPFSYSSSSYVSSRNSKFSFSSSAFFEDFGSLPDYIRYFPFPSLSSSSSSTSISSLSSSSSSSTSSSSLSSSSSTSSSSLSSSSSTSTSSPFSLRRSCGVIIYPILHSVVRGATTKGSGEEAADIVRLIHPSDVMMEVCNNRLDFLKKKLILHQRHQNSQGEENFTFSPSSPSFFSSSSSSSSSSSVSFTPSSSSSSSPSSSSSSSSTPPFITLADCWPAYSLFHRLHGGPLCAEFREVILASKEIGAKAIAIDRNEIVPLRRLQTKLLYSPSEYYGFYRYCEESIKFWKSSRELEKMEDLRLKLFSLSPAAYTCLVEERAKFMAMMILEKVKRDQITLVLCSALVSESLEYQLKKLFVRENYVKRTRGCDKLSWGEGSSDDSNGGGEGSSSSSSRCTMSSSISSSSSSIQASTSSISSSIMDGNSSNKGSSNSSDNISDMGFFSKINLNRRRGEEIRERRTEMEEDKTVSYFNELQSLSECPPSLLPLLVFRYQLLPPLFVFALLWIFWRLSSWAVWAIFQSGSIDENTSHRGGGRSFVGFEKREEEILMKEGREGGRREERPKILL